MVWLNGGKNLFFIFFLFINARAYWGHVTGALKISKNFKKFQKISKNFKCFQIFFFNTELVFAKLPPLTLHNLLADRPAPRGAAGGAGGGTPLHKERGDC